MKKSWITQPKEHGWYWWKQYPKTSAKPVWVGVHYINNVETFYVVSGSGHNEAGAVASMGGEYWGSLVPPKYKERGDG